MMTPAHLFGGYLALRTTKKWWQHDITSLLEKRSLWLTGLVLSIAIDLDVLLVGGITGHHRLLTHYPLFWLVVSLSTYLYGKSTGHSYTMALAKVILVTSWTHLALDLVGVTMGIHLFWPFSMHEFSVTPLHTQFATEASRWAYIWQSPITLVGDSIVMVTGIMFAFWDLKSASIKL